MQVGVTRPANSLGQYIASLQTTIGEIQQFLNSKFIPPSENLDLGGSNILRAGSIFGTSLELSDLLVAPTPTTQALTLWSDGTSLNSVNSVGAAQTFLTVGGGAGTYLPLAGGTMTGNLNMGGHNITNVALIAPVNSIHIGTSITDGFPTNNNVLIGTNVVGSGIDIASSGCVAIGNLTTVASHGQTVVGYNSTAGAIGTPNCLAIGVAASSVTSNSIAIGNTAATSIGNGAIALGHASIGSNINAIAVGDTSTASAVGSIAVGPSTTASAAEVIAIGDTSTASAAGAVAIGQLSVASAVDAITIGVSATNATAHSCLVGDAAIVNIRPNSAVCDLGTVAAPFQNVFASSGLDSGSGALTVGATNATSLGLGRAAINTTVNGTFVIASAPYASLYSTAGFSTGTLGAGTNTPVTPGATALGPASQFIAAANILSYSGTRNRTFKVDWNITFTTPAYTTIVGFFNSVNGSTTTGTTSAQVFQQVIGATESYQVNAHLTELVTIPAGQSVQLGINNSAGGVITFVNVSCVVSSMYN